MLAGSRLATVFRGHGKEFEGWVFGLSAASGALWLLTGDWIGSAGLWVLWAGWRYLWVSNLPPVLPLAFTFQWIQVTVGIYYCGLTGRRLDVMDQSDYRPMVLIGLGCLLALLVGLTIGLKMVRQPYQREEGVPPYAFSWGSLISLYLASVAVTATVQELALELPGLRQGLLALTYGRFALLFLIFRRLSQPRVQGGWIGALLAGEIVLGFTGYFAGFREPLMIAAIALMGAFDRRKVKHWIGLTVLGIVMLLTGTLWMGIRGEYRADFESEMFTQSREDRLERILQLSSGIIQGGVGEMAANMESFVDRLWAVYYPALAVSRVPSLLPYENGALLWNAVGHALTPRLLFPEKDVLPSDSEMVREYSGIWVAGAEEGTSIAFGYAGESYIDFGVPLMFLPIFIYGVLMGVAFQWWLRAIRSRELAVALVTVVFWMSLYLFERSWAKTLGGAGTLMIYLGGATYVVDHLLFASRRGQSGAVRFATTMLRGPLDRVRRPRIEVGSDELGR